MDTEANSRSLEPHFSSAVSDRFPTATSRLGIASDEDCKQIFEFFSKNVFKLLNKMDLELFEMQHESVQNEPQSHTVQNEDISEKLLKI